MIGAIQRDGLNRLYLVLSCWWLSYLHGQRSTLRYRHSMAFLFLVSQGLLLAVENWGKSGESMFTLVSQQGFSCGGWYSTMFSVISGPDKVVVQNNELLRAGFTVMNNSQKPKILSYPWTANQTSARHVPGHIANIKDRDSSSSRYPITWTALNQQSLLGNSARID